MKLLILCVAWCILFILNWPAAVLILVFAPIIWLLAVPFRFALLCIEAVLALARAVLFLPARFLMPHDRA